MMCVLDRLRSYRDRHVIEVGHGQSGVIATTGVGDQGFSTLETTWHPPKLFDEPA